MRRTKAFKRGRVVSILVAGGIGYMLGAWHGLASNSSTLTPAQTVALRFPENVHGAVRLDRASDQLASADPTMSVGSTNSATHSASTARSLNAGVMASAMVLGDPQLALLNPDPMMPQEAPETPPPAAGQDTPPATTAPPRSTPEAAAPAAPHGSAAVRHHSEAESRERISANHRATHTGVFLNDARIARIKQRLHLTPDQERMWPAVEAALRRVAYAKAHAARQRGGASGATDLASADPNSPEVQGLKSAAIPLLMSFSAEQKSEVRNLAHGMGLDNLAAQL